MSGDPFSITENKQHLSGVLDGTEIFPAVTSRRATTSGRANLAVTIDQITAYVVANGGGGGGLSAIANNTVLGNTSGGSAVPVATDAPTLRTMLGLAAIATSGSGADLTANSVALSKLPTQADQTILGNNSGGAAVPSALTMATVATMLPAASIAASQLATQANNTVLGNISGGAASPVALTTANITALVNAVVGDSGSGGTKGAVPAPASGDAAAGKFLKADGTWAIPGGSGLVSQANNTLFGNLSGGAAVPGSLTPAQANTIIGTPLTAAPGSPVDGQLATADGTNWDPLGRGSGRPYRVIYSSGQTAWFPDTPTMMHPGYVAGRWYMPPMPANAGATIVVNTIKLYSVTFPSKCVISQLAARIVTTSASSHLLCGIYASDPSTHNPTGNPLSTCVLDTATSTGVVSAALGSNVTILPGTYWFATLSDGTPQLNAVATATGFGAPAHTNGHATLANLWAGSVSFNAGWFYSTGVTYAGGLIDMTGKTLSDVGANANVPILAFLCA